MVDRALVLTTPAVRAATVLSAVAQEELSSLFRVELEVAAQAGQPLGVGQRVVVSVASAAGKTDRYFSGICTRVAESAAVGGATTYRVSVGPSVSTLARQRHSRIFQDMSAVDVLKKVLAGFDVTFMITATIPRRVYCVQYRETDFEFAQRLIEEEGMFFYFQHTAQGDKMIVSDSASSASDIGGVAFGAQSPPSSQAPPRVNAFERVQEMRAGTCTLRDFDFEHPQLDLTAAKTSASGNTSLEIFDYPGGYRNKSDGERYAQIRLDQETSSAVSGHGVSTIATMTAGAKMSLSGSGRGDGQWLLSGVQLDIAQRTDVAPTIACRFTCMPMSSAIRPQRRTKKPVIGGVQTAVVVGPAGETVHCDKYGRVKVHFRWDREGKNDDTSSCWIRIGALWGGTRHGSVGLPMMGNEVVVAFEEGDPDRPIIVGSVYNAAVMPPVALPANK